VKVWCGTQDEWVEEGRFKTIDEYDIIIKDGKALDVRMARRMMSEEGKWPKRGLLDGLLVVWDEKC